MAGISTAHGGEERKEGRFEEIIGNSSALRRVLEQVDCVAPTDASVLVLGRSAARASDVATVKP